MLNGYDISNNQGDIDNTLVPGDFVIIKASEGVGYTDPDCDANYQQAIGAGKKVGVYHFARPDGNSAVAEADWFHSQVKGYVGQAVFVLDLETQPITPEWALAFLDRFHEHTGVRAWLYGSKSMFENGDWSAVWANYAAWVAAYGLDMPQNGYGAPTSGISIPGDWTIAAWQYTSRGHLPNFGGFLDLNVFYGDRTAWDKYAALPTAPAPVLAPAPEPTPTPEPVTPPVIAPEQPPVVVPVPVVAPTPAPVDPPIVVISGPVKDTKGNSMFSKLTPYTKFIVAILGAAITTVVSFYGDNQYVVIAVAFLTALGVYHAPNASK